MRALRLLSLLVAGPALAQGTPKGTEAFLACARIAGDAERLACYDRTVAALSAEGKRLAAERAAAAEAAEKARATRVESFGARGVSPAQREERIDRIEASIAETFTDSQRKLVFLLDNGQMWRQTDGVFLAIVRPGTPVSVRRATMGGFTLRIESLNRSVPVMRVR
ncbi:hypothetical protein [Thermaurantiacus sp.]